MTKIFKNLRKNNILVAILLLGILYLGNQLRFFNYDKVPHPGETADEYVFAWVGLSVIKEGVPVGWTSVSTGYKDIWYEKINVDDLYAKDPEHLAFRMTKPWFDKPPGFALLVGTYSYFKGAKEFFQTGVGIIRRLMLRVAIITSLLIFILATRLFNKWVGLVATLLYSAIPTTVISSRLVLAENGYIPLFLASLIVVDYYFAERRKIFLVFSAILGAIAVFFKLSGISILLTLLLLIIAYGPKNNKSKDLILTFAIGITGFLAFVFYGIYYDWQIFKDVFLAQSNLIYGAGSEAFLSAVVRSKVTATKFLSDGWITLAWISAFIISAMGWKKDRGVSILTISLFSYLVVFLVFGSEGYGWYRFPFLPFLVIALAKLIERIFKESNLFLFLVLALFPFGTSVHRLWGYEGFSGFVFPLRLFLILATLLFAGLIVWRSTLLNYLYKFLIVLVFGFLVWLAVKEIYFFNYDSWFYVT